MRTFELAVNRTARFSLFPAKLAVKSVLFAQLLHTFTLQLTFDTQESKAAEKPGAFLLDSS
jgi:hypothetical protein